MATVTLKGSEIHTLGTLPETGTPAPDFTMTRGDLSLVSRMIIAGRNWSSIFFLVSIQVLVRSLSELLTNGLPPWRIQGFCAFPKTSPLPNPDSVGLKV